MQPAHPYYPLDANIPAYLPNNHSILYLITVFAAACVVALSVTGWVSKIINPRLRYNDLSIVLWFVLSGCIHIFFEGYLVFNIYNLPGLTSIRAQLWKEYALSDSRYLTLDTFVVSIEGLTVAFIGPLCFLTAFCTAVSSPLRHPLQIVVSVLHMYGATLYYVTALFDAMVKGIHHSRPEAYYVWIYCVGFNLPWIIVSGLITWHASSTVCNVFARVSDLEARLNKDEANGKVKKVK